LTVELPSTSTDPGSLLSLEAGRTAREPRILTRAEHSISRRDINENALRVMYRLVSFHYKAYLVGGGVRDLLLHKKPKDFDVGTDARPSRLKKIFRNCRIIGRRFRIAHVYFPDGNIIEVSTFRRGTQRKIQTASGAIITDNEYGSPQEDALRRDITINGLFYDIENFSVIDYVGGVEDLRDRIIRTISDPELSFREDPVRMIRVERHAARTGFEIEPNTLRAIYVHRHEIRTANTARLLEEALKDLRGGAAEPFFRLMMETHLLDSLLPSLSEQLREAGPGHPFWGRMRALDRRIQEGASYTTPVLLGVLLHTVLFPDATLWDGARNNPPDVWRTLAASWREVSKTLRVPRRDTERVAQILISYRKLVQSVERGRLLPALIRKPYLSEALDFLETDLEARGEAGGAPHGGHGGPPWPELVKEWRQHAPPPPPPEPRYRFLFEKQEPDMRQFAEMTEREFHEGAIEVREGEPGGRLSHDPARGRPTDAAAGANKAEHPGAPGGASRGGPGGDGERRPRRRRRRHRGGRRR
jgi:poly(A) polymerase